MPSIPDRDKYSAYFGTTLKFNEKLLKKKTRRKFLISCKRSLKLVILEVVTLMNVCADQLETNLIHKLFKTS